MATNPIIPRTRAFPRIPSANELADPKKLHDYLVLVRTDLQQAFDTISYHVKGNLSGPLSQRPPAGMKGRIYLATNTLPEKLYVDDGTNWVAFGSYPFLAPQITSASPANILGGGVFFGGSTTPGADQSAILPSSTGSGDIKQIKKLDNNAQSIVVSTPDGALIDGLPTLTVGPTQYDAAMIGDMIAGNWSILNVYP